MSQTGKIIVLLTRGKGNIFVGSVEIQLFNSRKEAEKYCKNITVSAKYWRFAQIIEEGEDVKFIYPKDYEMSR